MKYSDYVSIVSVLSIPFCFGFIGAGMYFHSDYNVVLQKNQSLEIQNQTLARIVTGQQQKLYDLGSSHQNDWFTITNLEIDVSAYRYREQRLKEVIENYCKKRGCALLNDKRYVYRNDGFYIGKTK